MISSICCLVNKVVGGSCKCKAVKKKTAKKPARKKSKKRK